MTDEELKAIEERAAKATPGPWTNLGRRIRRQAANKMGEPIVEMDSVNEDADSDFITHAREDVPVLVAEVRRLRGIQSAIANYLNTNTLYFGNPDARASARMSMAYEALQELIRLGGGKT